MTTLKLMILLGLALAASLLLTRFFIRLAFKLGVVDRPGHRKIHTNTVAYLGGAAIFTSIISTLGVCALWICDIHNLEINEIHKVMFILVSSLGVMALGLWDDVSDLRPKYKLIGQIALASAFAVFGFRFEILHIPGLPPMELGLLAVPLTVFWIVAIVNAFNMMDGVDGLTTSVSLVSLLLIAATAAFLGNRAEVALCLVAGMTVLGFLLYNWSPARIYLGDAGSGGLGMFIAASLVSLGQTHSFWLRGGMDQPPVASQPFFYQIFIVTLFLAYPALEIVSTVARRFVHGRPIGRADKGHIHHRLLDRGFSAKAISLIGAGFTILAGLAAMAIIMQHNGKAAWLLGVSGLVLGIGISNLKFLDFLHPKAIEHNKPHYLIAHHFIEMQRAKLGLSQSREEVLSLVAQICNEFGVRGYHLLIPSDRKGMGGVDYSYDWEPSRQMHLSFLQASPKSASLVFSDQFRLPGHQGGAQWIFQPHTAKEEDLDVEYRVLVHEFMKEAMVAVARLGKGRPTLELTGVVNHPPTSLSGHALRKRYHKASHAI